MPDLVAIDLAGPAFADAVRRAWDAGEAVLPVDRRLPAPARRALLAAMAPTHVQDGGGRRAVEGGRGVEIGDALVMATSGSTGVPKGKVIAMPAHASTIYPGTTRDWSPIGAVTLNPERDSVVADHMKADLKQPLAA